MQNTLLDTVVTPDLPPSASSEAVPVGPNAAASTAKLQKSPYCGDGVCTAGETCATCPQDCKQVIRFQSLTPQDAAACSWGLHMAGSRLGVKWDTTACLVSNRESTIVIA